MIGLVSLVVNYFVSFKTATLKYAVSVELYSLLIRKILFQKANESAYSKTKCKKNIHVSEKTGMITRHNALYANQ